jgi:methylamine utilization protein MauE
MNMLALGAKSALAALLLVAGGAKLADLAGFASTVRLFMPPRASWPVLRGVALAITLAELALGAASLSSPALSWLNPVIFGLGCGFVAVSVTGYALHRGRSCRCFGALSARTFNAAGIARSMVIAAAAAAAVKAVRPSSVQLAPAERVLLLAVSCLLAFAAFTAASALATSRAAQPRLAPP